MSTLATRSTSRFADFSGPTGSSSPQVRGRETMSILVVDDERTLREGCAAALQADGYEVTALGRGDEALQLVSRRRFDIILVDQYLTPVPGMDILKAALATHRETIVIVMTGN